VRILGDCAEAGSPRAIKPATTMELSIVRVGILLTKHDDEEKRQKQRKQ